MEREREREREREGGRESEWDKAGNVVRRTAEARAEDGCLATPVPAPACATSICRH